MVEAAMPPSWNFGWLSPHRPAMGDARLPRWVVLVSLMAVRLRAPIRF
jgi:hypothetical protein